MGWDLRSGLRLTRGSYVGFIDGDGQMPIEDVGKLYELISSGDFDLVKTYRVRRADGWKRRVLTTMYNLIFRILFPRLNARDMNAKPKIMRRAAYESMILEASGWFIDAEIMIESNRLSLRIGEIPTEFRQLRRRASFVSFRAVFEFLWNLLRSRFRAYRRRPPFRPDL